ncbi:FAD-dependent oxidoreductase [Pseudonocardia sp. NPDC049635]|uniref:FAD-dependent oxidoreductase n=1 Tax=Pseudonocardia sp. NPDC049635 TaxID=3155506 RepID=UPI0033E7AB7E
MTADVERLVIGGGIGGLSTALALARHGLSVHVLEQAPEFSEIGAGVQLAPNALRVLNELGVLTPVLRDAVFPARAMMRDAITGERLAELDFGDDFRAAYGFAYCVTHRSDLLDALLSACRADHAITLEPGKAVTALDQREDAVTVRCADGSAYRARAVVGADGIWSVARKHVLGDGDPTFVGDVAYRGTAPINATNFADGDNLTWWVGPGIHLIHYPVRGGKMLNQVAVFVARQDGDPSSWGPPEELDRAFAGTTKEVADGMQLLTRERRWVLRDRPPSATWTRGRVTLLGDAAHPMAQYLAQGACQALEDALVLSRCLAEHSDDIAKAFDAYEAERLPRTGRVQTWARRMGEIVHGAGVTAILRDELLRRCRPTDLPQLDWLYSHRPVLERTHLTQETRRCD